MGAAASVSSVVDMPREEEVVVANKDGLGFTTKACADERVARTAAAVDNFIVTTRSLSGSSCYYKWFFVN